LLLKRSRKLAYGATALIFALCACWFAWFFVLEPAIWDWAPWNLNNDGPPIRRSLVRAADEGNIERVEELLARGRHPDQVARNGDTALVRAVWKNHVDVIEALLKAGADPDKPGRWGRTPLETAMGQCNAQSVELLVRHGADPNRKSQQGFITPYQAARTYVRDYEDREMLDAIERGLKQRAP
jgi:ankyrin repeat protein